MKSYEDNNTNSDQKGSNIKLYDYDAFEVYVAEVFKMSGYTVQTHVPHTGGKKDIDIVAEKLGEKCFVEVKFSQVTERTILQIISIAAEFDATPVIVTASKISDIKRKDCCKKHPNVILVDIANLLYAVQDNTDLRNKLISVLPYAIDDIEPQEGFLQSDTLMHSNYAESLIEELKLCSPGNPLFGRYEKLCQSLLEFAFSEDLALWKPQLKSNNDLYRFDLLCRIKDGNQKTFWSILERFFNSKYIIFEFKNHKDVITQKEIYTTEKYLYAKSLRSVGIIIAANGCHENAYWAAKGCLRENGKLIILLNNNDLIKIVEMKMEQDDPSDYLLAKLDELLLELEK